MKQAVAVAVIVALGIVGGSAISQTGQANAGYDSYLREFKKIEQHLDRIRDNIFTMCLDMPETEIGNPNRRTPYIWCRP